MFTFSASKAGVIKLLSRLFIYVLWLLCIIYVISLSNHEKLWHNQSTDGREQQDRSKGPWLVFANRSECKKASHHRPTDEFPPLPVTQLLSVQGSGNTWLRWLIERLTGICTGSAYQEKMMVWLGFRCEVGLVYDGRTIVQKSHYFRHLNTTRVLLLVRNPFDALVADFHRMHTRGNHTGIALQIVFQTEEWEKFVILRSGEWLEQILTTVSNATDLCVVFYENLKTDLRKELHRVAEFLRVYISDARISCVLENHAGRMKRAKRKHKDKDLFSDFHVELVSLAIARAVHALKSAGVPNIPSEYLAVSNKVSGSMRQF